MNTYKNYNNMKELLNKKREHNIPVTQKEKQELMRLQRKLTNSSGMHLFDRFFSKKTSHIVWLWLLAGLIAYLIHFAMVAPTTGWKWIDLINFPGFWLWIESLKPCIFYLILRPVVGFLNPNIEDGAASYRAHHVSMIDRVISKVYGPSIWNIFHPLSKEYAEVFYAVRSLEQYNKNVCDLNESEVKGLNETYEEIERRHDAYDYIKQTEKVNGLWTWKEVMNLQHYGLDYIIDEHNLEMDYQNKLAELAEKNNWDDWKDIPHIHPKKHSYNVIRKNHINKK